MLAPGTAQCVMAHCIKVQHGAVGVQRPSMEPSTVQMTRDYECDSLM